MSDKPQYDPQKHHRRSIRLKGYDYTQAGAYFITICCHKKECRFGNVADVQMELNQLGATAYNEWLKLPERFANVELDVFQIMPNHMHGIIILHDPSVVGAGFTPALDRPPTVGVIVGAYKSLVANACLEFYKSRNEGMGKLWQRNYFEHIVRNEKSYHKISDYIVNNPSGWQQDKFYVAG